jgi:HK97 family phage major capsid protein
MDIEQVKRQKAALRAKLEPLSKLPTLTRAQELEFEKGLSELESLNASEKSLERRTNMGTDDGRVQGVSHGELQDRALRVLEVEGRRLAPSQLDHVDHLLRHRSQNCDGSVIARRLLITETAAYRSAFQKGVTQSSPAFTNEEAHALDEFRAASEGTATAGGFGIPVLIDPTIILTSGAIDAPLLQLATVKTITTDAWKGVSSAGVSWSYDAEASAVSDDSPTLAQPSIPVYSARGFIPYSIEVGQDYPGFADEMAMLLNQGFIDLLASQTMVGSGSSQPRGLFTAMSATTSNPSHVVVTTTGVFVPPGPLCLSVSAAVPTG